MHSLRWRIATWYTLLLLCVIGLVSIVLFFQLRTILFDQARARIDQIGRDIASIVSRSGPLVAIGEAFPVDEQLALPGNLEHWSSPTTYVEIDNAQGYPIGKSQNMGGVSFARRPSDQRFGVTYSVEKNALGDIYVRDERVKVGGATPIIVKVGERLDVFNETLRRTRDLLLFVFLFAVAAVIAASIFLSSSAIRPIGELTEAIGEIGSDQLNRRLAWTDRTDEVGRLAATFDAMLARLEEAFARERQFISDASHELKTPLTIINANAQMLERWGDRDPHVRTDSLRAIVEESAALARMVNGLLTLAKAESGERIPLEPVRLSEVLSEAVRSSASRAAEKSLVLRLSGDLHPGPCVLGNANLLRQLFSNLIENGIKFTERGEVEVNLAATADEAVVHVSDTGVGIEEESLARIFDRFYRTDRSRSRAVEGTGLGLAIVRSIARVHEGTVQATRRAGGGTAFQVTLPRIATRAASASEAPPEQAFISRQ
ncbi:MAG: HAMP domain-containing histidine kinase [Candidatus Eremiobacteraeota bacterium]|nr:HAMP domain-containing histidine kinase [Candidatus Eremiobacteraeota bacterium]